jgi:hypothetical protein
MTAVKMKKTTHNIPQIYSKRTIWGFSVLMTPLFGGVMLMHDLNNVGKKKAAYLSLLTSILFTATACAVMKVLKEPSSGWMYAINIVGGYVLAEIYHKMGFPPSKYSKHRDIWKPLLIAIGLFIVLAAGYVYSA